MKIVVLGLRGFPDIQGGVETHCEQLFTRVAARGHEVVVLGRKPYMNATFHEYKGVRLVAIACPRHKSLEAFLHTFVGVLRARAFKPDILHLHAIGPALFTPLARLLGMKVVSTNHGPDYERAKWGMLARAILRAGETMGSRCSNAVIAISPPIAEHLRQAFGCSPAVIPNGVLPRTPASGQESLEQYGLQAGRYLLAVGRLVPEKGIHDLMDAYVQAALPGWKLVIVGEADHADAYSIGLKQKAASIPGVVLTGFLTGEALAQIYSHAGVFVLPSYHEGLPIVLLEAMSYGLRVLASDIPPNRQVSLPDEQFFAPGDVAAAAERIKSFSARDFSEELRQRQIAYVTRNFDWNQVTDQTIAVYDAVLANSTVTT